MSIQTKLLQFAVVMMTLLVAIPAAPQESEKPPEEPPPEAEPILPPGGESQMMSSGGGLWDGTPAPPSFSTSGHTGAFSTAIPIRVPSYHGLEPSVTLAYNSSGGNGFAGVGWNVSGFSQITRKSADGGWPNWDGTDAFWLGGQKLVPCGASSSPGCSAGGTHFAENENYLRITDNGDDTWTVTDRGGVQSEYLPMGASGADIRRFGLATRTDTLGNTVSYSWSCTTDTDYCYPETIAYNGALITFHRDTRPDPMSMAGKIDLEDRLTTSPYPARVRGPTR